MNESIHIFDIYPPRLKNKTTSISKDFILTRSYRHQHQTQKYETTGKLAFFHVLNREFILPSPCSNHSNSSQNFSLKFTIFMCNLLPGQHNSRILIQNVSQNVAAFIDRILTRHCSVELVIHHHLTLNTERRSEL